MITQAQGWLVTQNPSACLRAFKRSFGRKSGTLPSHFHPLPSPSRSSLKVKRTDRRRTEPGRAIGRAGEVRGGTGTELGTGEEPPGPTPRPCTGCCPSRTHKEAGRQAQCVAPVRFCPRGCRPRWNRGEIPGVPGQSPALKCVVAPTYSGRILRCPPPLRRLCLPRGNLPREEAGKGPFPGSNVCLHLPLTPLPCAASTLRGRSRGEWSPPAARACRLMPGGLCLQTLASCTASCWGALGLAPGAQQVESSPGGPRPGKRLWSSRRGRPGRPA